MGTRSVVITGGTGFIGSHLTLLFLKNGYEVIHIVRDTTTVWGNRQKNLSAVRVSELEKLKQLNIVGVVHCATSYGHEGRFEDVIKCNIDLASSVLATAIDSQFDFFINIDSFFSKPGHDYAHLPVYTASKRFFYELCRHNSDKIRVVNARLEHVYGEQDNPKKFVSKLIHDLQSDVPEIPLTEGSQRRDFIYVEDVVQALFCIVNNVTMLERFSEFEIGTGQTHTLREFVETAHRLTNSRSHLLFGALNQRRGEIENSTADILPLQKLGWKPKFTLAEGIMSMLKNQRTEN